MVKKVLLIDSQKTILYLATYLVLFVNFSFFTKLNEFALAENNYTVAVSAPFILFMLLVLVLNGVLFITHKHSFKGVIFILIFVSALSSYFMNTFGTIIDKDMIANAFQTDKAEAFDLITIKLFIYVILFCILPAYILFKHKIEYKNYKTELLNRIFVIFIALVITVTTYSIMSKNYSSFFRNHGEIRYYLNPSYPIYSFAKYVKRELKAPDVITPIATGATREKKDKKRLFVFVVGETARAANFSLNGYANETNPLLKTQDDIVNLSNFYSCGTATAISLPCMFSNFARDEYSDDKKYYENLVDVLSKTGVKTIWRDNNSGRSKGVADRVEDVKYYGGENFDEIMLEDLQQSIDISYEDTFVVLHQEGSHGPTYYKRYPDSFKKFKPTCDTQELEKCTQEEIVNTYDNTILYTDYLLDKTIKFLQSNEEKYETFMMYASDHGESLGENGIYLHGLPYSIAPEYQKHIPAICYFSRDTQDKKEMLEASKSDEYSHDNIFHTVLGFFGVSTKEYNKDLDIFFSKKIS